MRNSSENNTVMLHMFLMVVMMTALELYAGVDVNTVSLSFFLEMIVLKVCIERITSPLIMIILLTIANIAVAAGPNALATLLEILRAGAR